MEINFVKLKEFEKVNQDSMLSLNVLNTCLDNYLNLLSDTNMLGQYSVSPQMVTIITTLKSLGILED